jgi:hypothetical protein
MKDTSHARGDDHPYRGWPYWVAGPVRLADGDGREIPHPDPVNP